MLMLIHKKKLDDEKKKRDKRANSNTRAKRPADPQSMLLDRNQQSVVSMNLSVYPFISKELL